MISLKNVSITIENNEILKDINLNISAGEKIAVIGPSGAGKTTLLNLICKQLDSFKGNITIDNKNISEHTSSREYANNVGIIRQQFDLIEPMTVRNNVLAGKLKEWSFLKSLKSLVFPQDLELAEIALESVRMNDKIHSKVNTLSGGEKQRVAIARLLIQDPKIILADEPIASLDPSLSDEILNLLIKSSISKTLLVSIHSVEHALKYFDRVIALKDGELYFDYKTTNITELLIKELYER